MAISNLPLRSNPKLFDRVIQDIQQGLKDGLSWLDYSFGRAERLIKVVDGRRLYTPNVYTGDGNYELVLPDSVKFGNYAFWTVDEPKEVINESPIEVKMRANASLIIWVDMRKVGDDTDERNTEAVMEQVMMTLKEIRIFKGTFKIERVYEKAENVFEGFSLDEVQNQFMMSPYYGWRFYGEMTITNDCIL